MGTFFGFLLLVWAVPAFFVARYAERKGRSGGWFFFWTLILSPFITGIIAVLCQDRPVGQLAQPMPQRSLGPFPERFSPPVRPDPAASRIDNLRKLAELHRSGALTEDEFAAEKRHILDNPTYS
jgi:hypothetical protein